MKCTNPELGRFALLSDREPDEKLPDSVREHLSECVYCAEKRKVYDGWLGSLASKTGPHLETDALLAYQHVSLTAEQQRKTENHLANCRQCSEALAKLNAAFDSPEQIGINTLESAADWTSDHESTFVARLKRELELSGLLAGQEPRNPEPERKRAQIHSWRGPWSVFEWSVVGVAALIIVTAAVLLINSSLRRTTGENQNLVGKDSPPASPLPTKSAENQNVTVQQPVPQPTRNARLSSPEPPAAANTQVFAFIFEPARAPSERREITISRAFIRFAVTINGPAVSRSFRVELIDEEQGRTIGGQQRVRAQLGPDHRAVTFTLPTNELINTFYTLRLTGLAPSGKTAEVFTTYLKLSK